MKDRIWRAFDEIRADDALLTKTAAYLQTARLKRETKRSPQLLRLAGALAAMLVLAVGIFGYRAVYSAPAAYVSIDVNPSVELTLNRMDNVLDAIAFNTEGEALLQATSIRGRPYAEAVSALLAEMRVQGYFSGDALVTMTVQTANGAKERILCDTLLQTATGQTDAGRSAAEIEVFPVTREVRESAHGCHMSAAKYMAIQELMEVDETATLEAYGNTSLHQIRQRTQACRAEHGNGSGNGSGSAGGGNGSGNHGHGQGGGHGHGYRGGR